MIGKLLPIWKGNRAYIIGGGPSVNDFDIDYLRSKRIIVINNAYKLIPWADILYFMDTTWWGWHEDYIRSFRGLIVTTCDKCRKEPGIIYLKHGRSGKIDPRPTHLSRGSNSGYGAIGVAVKLGVKEIILATGFDMKMVDGRHNYHNEHKDRKQKNIYEVMHMKSFEKVTNELAAMGITIVNCTPDSALKHIPQGRIEEWI